MDATALRNWGIGVSGALMAAALMLSLQPSLRAQAETAAPLQAAGVAPAAHVAFLVRFRGNGPIARAQARAMRGDTEAAQIEIAAQLRRQIQLRGLCFDRFTAGAAEVVLRTCVAIVASEREATERSWLDRLRAMRAVEYVDANATAAPERRPGE